MGIEVASTKGSAGREDAALLVVDKGLGQHIVVDALVCVQAAVRRVHSHLAPLPLQGTA